MPAPSAQYQPGHDRHVVVPRDLPPAGRTARARVHQRPPARQPVDHHVEETADNRPDDARQRHRSGYCPAPGLTPDTLAAGDVAPGVLDDARAAVGADTDERVLVVVDVHAVRADVNASGSVHEGTAIDRETTSQAEQLVVAAV